MSNRVCSTCGEEYSDTYRRCPFCEEDEAIRRGHPPHRSNGGKRLEKQRRSNGGAGGVMLLLTSVIIMGVIVYVFWGDRIAGSIGIRSDPTELGFGHEDDSSKDNDTNKEQDPAPPPPEGTMVISQSAMTLSAGETALLAVSGNEGEVTWTSSDEQIAVVKNGTVTAKAGGSVTITATAGEESASCALQVNGEPPSPSGGSGSNGSGGGSTRLSLSKTDFTYKPSDPTVTLKVSGTSSAVTWASKDSSVAAVSDSGAVTWVGKGTTTITASVDGQVLECIVRCKS